MFPPLRRQEIPPEAGTVDPILIEQIPRLYIILISLHGLVRGDRMELGRDPDTGGQVREEDKGSVLTAMLW
jgi:hypothetical protein